MENLLARGEKSSRQILAYSTQLLLTSNGRKEVDIITHSRQVIENGRRLRALSQAARQGRKFFMNSTYSMQMYSIAYCLTHGIITVEEAIQAINNIRI